MIPTTNEYVLADVMYAVADYACSRTYLTRDVQDYEYFVERDTVDKLMEVYPDMRLQIDKGLDKATGKYWTHYILTMYPKEVL